MSRSSFSKGCTPARGSGRAGVKRRLSSALKTGSGKSPVHACISGIRKLARRAGVMRIGKGVMDDPNDGALLALKLFLRDLCNSLIVLTAYARRMTVTANDVSYALKRRGITMYSLQGCDWTYGFYNRQRVRSRIAGTRLTQSQLTAAAEHFAATASQGGSAATQQEGGVQREAEAPAQRPVAQQQQQPPQSPVPSAAHSAAAAVAGVPTPQAQQPAELPGASAAAVAPVVTAAEGWCGDGDAPASAAPAGERRLSGVPTPAVVSEARAAEIQHWMAEEMLELQKVTDQLGVREHDLRRVMVGKHGCSAGEVQHVLFCLERLERVMVEEGTIYPCC